MFLAIMTCQSRLLRGVCSGRGFASGGSLLAPVIASLGAAEGREEPAPPVAFAAVYALVAVAWECLTVHTTAS